jgi:hypothetical protein
MDFSVFIGGTIEEGLMSRELAQYGGGDEYEWLLVLVLVILFRIIAG